MRKYLVLVGVVLLVWAQIGVANIPVQPAAKPAKLPAAEIARLQAEPNTLLVRFPNGGAAMAQYVARAIITEPGLAGSLVSVAGQAASPRQSASIGAGLARGARALGAKNAAVAKAISGKIGQSENKVLKVTFQAIGPNFLASLPAKLPANLPVPPTYAGEVGHTLNGEVARLSDQKRLDLVLPERVRLQQTPVVSEVGGVAELPINDVMIESPLAIAMVSDANTPSALQFTARTPSAPQPTPSISDSPIIVTPVAPIPEQPVVLPSTPISGTVTSGPPPSVSPSL